MPRLLALLFILPSSMYATEDTNCAHRAAAFKKQLERVRAEMKLYEVRPKTKKNALEPVDPRVDVFVGPEGGLQVLQKLRGFKGSQQLSTATVLGQLAPHLDENSLRSVRGRMYKRLSRKTAGGVASDENNANRIEAAAEVFDSVYWLAEAHNEWVAARTDKSRLIDLTQLHTKDGMAKALVALRGDANLTKGPRMTTSDGLHSDAGGLSVLLSVERMKDFTLDEILALTNQLPKEVRTELEEEIRSIITNVAAGIAIAHNRSIRSAKQVMDCMVRIARAHNKWVRTQSDQSRLIDLPNLFTPEGMKHALNALRQRRSEMAPDTTAILMDGDHGGLSQLGLMDGFNNRSLDTRELLLSWVHHLSDKELHALHEKLTERRVGKISGPEALTGQLVSAQQVQDAVYWVAEAHNKWAKKNDPTRLIDLTKLETREGMRKALFAMTGSEPPIESIRVLRTKRSNVAPETLSTFRDRESGGLEVLRSISGMAGNNTPTADLLVDLVPYLREGELNILKEHLALSLTNKYAGMDALNSNSESAAKQVQDAIHWVAQVHNRWAIENAPSYFVDISILDTREGMVKALYAFKMAVPDGVTMLLAQDGMRGLNKPGQSTADEMLQFVQHLPKEKLDDLEKELKARMKGPESGARSTTKEITDAMLSIVKSHNAWVKTQPDQSRLIDTSRLFSADGMRLALYALRGRRTDIAPESLVAFRDIESGGLETLRLITGMAGNTRHPADSLVDLVPHIDAEERAELGKKLHARITGKATGMNALNGHIPAAQQIQDSIYWVIEAHNRWAQKRNRPLLIDISTIDSHEGMLAALQKLKQAGFSPSLVKVESLELKPGEKQSFAEFKSEGGGIFGFHSESLPGSGSRTYQAFIEAMVHLPISVRVELARKIRKWITDIAGSRLANPDEALGVFRSLDAITNAHNAFVETQGAGTPIAKDFYKTKQGVEQALLTLRLASDPALGDFTEFQVKETGGLAGIHGESLPGISRDGRAAMTSLIGHFSKEVKADLSREIKQWAANKQVGSNIHERRPDGKLQRSGVALGALRILKKAVKEHNAWVENHPGETPIPGDFFKTKQGVEQALSTMRFAADPILRDLAQFQVNETGGLSGLNNRSLRGFATNAPSMVKKLSGHLPEEAKTKLAKQIQKWMRDKRGHNAQMRNPDGTFRHPGAVLGILRSLDATVKAHNEWASINAPTKIIPADFSHTKEGVENAISILKSFNIP